MKLIWISKHKWIAKARKREREREYQSGRMGSHRTSDEKVSLLHNLLFWGVEMNHTTNDKNHQREQEQSVLAHLASKDRLI